MDKSEARRSKIDFRLGLKEACQKYLYHHQEPIYISISRQRGQASSQGSGTNDKRL